MAPRIQKTSSACFAVILCSLVQLVVGHNEELQPVKTSSSYAAAPNSKDSGVQRNGHDPEPRALYIVRLLGSPAVVHARDRSIKSLHHDAIVEHRAFLTAHQREVLSRLGRAAEALYHYTCVTHGFSVALTNDEARKLREMEDVVAVVQSRLYRKRTTYSWQFLGLNSSSKGLYRSKRFPYTGRSVWRRSKSGKGIVIGVADSGIWPESPSFSDKEMPPPPRKWRGVCQAGDDWPASTCNNKVVGARYYLSGAQQNGWKGTVTDYRANGIYRSCRDSEGHGSFIAGVAAGSVVSDAAAGGHIFGTAKGVAYNSHLAIYKVCWTYPLNKVGETLDCDTADITAAIEDAVLDGVDVLNLSLGSPAAEIVNGTLVVSEDLAFGVLEEATLHANSHGTLVVAAVGNSGPDEYSVSNTAPWLMTVGASTMDRLYRNRVILVKAKTTLQGQSVNEKKVTAPVITAASAALPNQDPFLASACVANSLNSTLVRGKIVVCLRGVVERSAKSLEVQRASGVGMILTSRDPTMEVLTDISAIPASHVDYNSSQEIAAYIKRYGEQATVTITPFQEVFKKGNPQMSSFSSAGPNPVDLNIIKPDVTAPGVNIFSAWSENPLPVNLDGFPLGGTSPLGFEHPSNFNFQSGTSFSAPHVAGIAANLRAIYKRWSPDMIRSAIMTTATRLDNRGRPIKDSRGVVASPNQMGSGHVFPGAALDPGLVYKSSYRDYVQYLCALYGRQRIKNGPPASSSNRSSNAHTKGAVHMMRCPKHVAASFNLNYPSISVGRAITQPVTVVRTVTNVAERMRGDEVYSAKITGLKGIKVTVIPKKLTFCKTGQEAVFQVILSPKSKRTNVTAGYMYGHLTWKSRSHTVVSPIQVVVPKYSIKLKPSID